MSLSKIFAVDLKLFHHDLWNEISCDVVELVVFDGIHSFDTIDMFFMECEDVIAVVVDVVVTEKLGTDLLVELRIVEHIFRNFMRQKDSLPIRIFESNV